jgi:uroporphyrin-III C-methyltransferase
VLRNADVVLHDDLVSTEILNLIPTTAQLINVGKRCGRKKITQAEINAQMIWFAQAGFEVVRLKSGDPLIFGRAGEEVTALRRAEVECELIGGVTAAFGAAAAAQIPLTQRGISSSVVFVSGHSATGNDANDWRALAALRATLVIYMPGYEYGTIADNLLREGLSAGTPCAIISRATTVEQQTYITDLSSLPEAPQLPAPTILIIGEVVQFANPLVTNTAASWSCCRPAESSAL